MAARTEHILGADRDMAVHHYFSILARDIAGQTDDFQGAGHLLVPILFLDRIKMCNFYLADCADAIEESGQDIFVAADLAQFLNYLIAAGQHYQQMVVTLMVFHK